MNAPVAELAKMPQKKVLEIKMAIVWPSWLIPTLKILGFLFVFCTAIGLIEMMP